MDTRRAGFTFVELLVALVISSILAIVVFQVLLSQGRFNRLFAAREEVQQNVRTGIDLLTVDLRSVAPGDQGGTGIVDATSDFIAFRTVRAWGLVCGEAGSNLAVLFPADAVGTLNGGADSLAYVLPAASWQFQSVSDVTESSVGVSRTTCNANLGPSPAVPTLAWQLSPARSYAFSGAGPLAVQLQGRRVYVYDHVTYSVGEDPEGRVPGEWLLRNGEPVAGPLPGGGQGLAFSFFDRTGAEIINPTTQAQLDAIYRIRLVLRTVSSGRISGGTDSHVDSVHVFLRNRILRDNP